MRFAELSSGPRARMGEITLAGRCCRPCYPDQRLQSVRRGGGGQAYCTLCILGKTTQRAGCMDGASDCLSVSSPPLMALRLLQ